MKLKTIVEKLELEVKTPDCDLSGEICGAYVSDLLSDVMANAKKGEIWITLQVHSNIIAVAVLKELAGIILVNNRQPEDETVQKAGKERIPLCTSKFSAFQLAGKLYRLIGEC